MNARTLWVLLLASTAACSSSGSVGFDVVPGLDGTASDTQPDPLDADGGASDDAASADAGLDVEPPGVDVVVEDTPPSDVTPTVSVFVFAHTSSELFQVNPRSFEVRRLGAFGFPRDGRNHEMTDIAITGDNQMWGVTRDTLYRVDPGTAACTFATNLAGGLLFNGLSFLPGTGGGPERLVATTREGEVYVIDRTSGAATRLGSYGGGYGSSGDLVSVYGAGTFATVVDDNLFFPTEYLARIDETTGAATIIGPTGATDSWGLGYWGGTLYGFTEGGQFETIDVATGRATVVPGTGPSETWWGAGVTTRAPITH